MSDHTIIVKVTDMPKVMAIIEEVAAENNELRAENDRLRAALHRIGFPKTFIQSRSVLSGIAREALEAES